MAPGRDPCFVGLPKPQNGPRMYLGPFQAVEAQRPYCTTSKFTVLPALK